MENMFHFKRLGIRLQIDPSEKPRGSLYTHVMFLETIDLGTI